SLAGEDLHRAYALISLPNDASVALHERFGFSLAGTMREIGRKFDRFWDVAFYEKPL
ncbi:MAG TPA: GNAT family N-acetyltransferase, partial [Propionibacteriaceae bacterium]|nr:GNAT family N-acetyltransferase [Propionibacteriaceae bacterium]